MTNPTTPPDMADHKAAAAATAAMNTDRDLIQRLANELDRYKQILMDDRRKTHPLATEARAYLDQPEHEGPKDEAAKRVTKFLDEYQKIRGIDPDVIHGLHAGLDEERTATLTVSDLRAILAAELSE